MSDMLAYFLLMIPGLKHIRQKPREILGIPLSEVVYLWRHHFPDAKHPVESTINRWELGRRVPSLDVLQLSEIYRRKAEELSQDIESEIRALLSSASDGDHDEDGDAVKRDAPSIGGKHYQISFGLLQTPDVAIAASVFNSLPQIDLKLETVENHEQIPADVASGRLDVALYRRDALKLHPVFRGPKESDSPFHVHPLMKHRSNAILAASNEGWETLNEIFINSAWESGSVRPRRERLQYSMGALVEQMKRRGVKASDFFIPRPSNRMKAMIALLTIGRDAVAPPGYLQGLVGHEPADYITNLIKDLKDMESKPCRGGECFQHFATRIVAGPNQKEKNNALFPAGLSHRLVAEDIGAAPLIDSDDLQSLAALNPSLYMPLFFPTSALIWSRDDKKGIAPAISLMQQAWNDHVVAFRELNPNVLQSLYARVDEFMESLDESVSWRTGSRMMERLVNEQLLEFIFWQ